MKSEGSVEDFAAFYAMSPRAKGRIVQTSFALTGREDAQMATDREYVDLKLEASEARAETRYAEMNAKLDRLLQASEAAQLEIVSGRAEVRQQYSSTRTTMVVTSISTAFALAALLMAVMTYGDAIFSRGMSVRDVVNALSKEQVERTAAPKIAPKN